MTKEDQLPKMRDMKTGIPDIDKLHCAIMEILEDSYALTVKHLRGAWFLQVKERIDRALGVEIPWEMVTGYLNLFWDVEAERQMYKHLCKSDVYSPYMTRDNLYAFLELKGVLGFLNEIDLEELEKIRQKETDHD